MSVAAWASLIPGWPPAQGFAQHPDSGLSGGEVHVVATGGEVHVVATGQASWQLTSPKPTRTLENSIFRTPADWLQTKVCPRLGHHIIAKLGACSCFILHSYWIPYLDQSVQTLQGPLLHRA